MVKIIKKKKQRQTTPQFPAFKKIDNNSSRLLQSMKLCKISLSQKDRSPSANEDEHFI